MRHLYFKNDVLLFDLKDINNTSFYSDFDLLVVSDDFCYKTEILSDDGISYFADLSYSDVLFSLYDIEKSDYNIIEHHKSLQYQRNRQQAYLKLNQDELRFNDLENNTTTWQDSIHDIKKQFPKPKDLK